MKKCTTCGEDAMWHGALSKKNHQFKKPKIDMRKANRPKGLKGLY